MIGKCYRTLRYGPHMWWCFVCRRAYSALAQYTRHTIADLQADDDEMLRGVDWAAVMSNADMGQAVKRVLRSSESLNRQGGNPVEQQHVTPGPQSKGPSTMQSSLLEDESLSEGLRGAIPESPMVLTRASLARNSASFRAMTVPLLGGQYKGAKERYASVDEESVNSDQEAERDLEAGQNQVSTGY